MAVNLTNRIKVLLPPSAPGGMGGCSRTVKGHDRGLKVAGLVKAAVNHLRLTSGNRLTVPGHGKRGFDVNRGA